jgi:hypothetical protein
MQEWFKKRMKWDSKKLEDDILSQRFKYNIIRRVYNLPVPIIIEAGRFLGCTAGMESHKKLYFRSRTNVLGQEMMKRN